MGPLTVFGPDGEAVPVGGRRQRAVLAVLALAEGAVTVDHLTDMAWGARPPADPKAAVETCVSRLRQALPKGHRVVYGGGAYRLDLTGSWFDVARFRELVAAAAEHRRNGEPGRAATSLREALGLWRGEPLADLADLPVGEAVRARLVEERLTAVGDCVRDELAAGRHRELVGELQQLVTDHPLREDLYALLLLALYRCGRQQDALAVYRQARETLIDELGVEPGPDLQTLHSRILTQDPTLAAPEQPEQRDQPRHNLTQSVTSFVGRDQDVAGVAELVRAARLVSLTGAGGVGKSRLAREVAAGLVDEYPDGVWLVELASLSSPDSVAREVADALGLVLEAGRPAVHPLVEYCRPRRTLVVLDNCEHLLEAAADLVMRLQRECPAVHVLTTSRQPLACEGEHVWPVPTLSTPRSAEDLALGEGLLAHGAIELFRDRARAVDPSFEVTPANAEVVARIGVQLEGLPLAIELAAAWVATLPCERIAERLQPSSEVLSTARRDAETRQRSLVATLEWSYELLGEAERAAFRQLAVFASGASLERAESVIAGTRDASSLRLLARLQACSLVVADHADGEARYRLLEPVRQFAFDKLEAAGEAAAARNAHAGLQRDLAERTQPLLRNDPASHGAVLAQLAHEHDELRAALDWAIPSEQTDMALGLVGHLWIFWWAAGHMLEAIDWLQRALALPGGSDELRAKALTGLAFLASQDFRWDAAGTHATAAVNTFHRLADAGQSAHYAYALFVHAEVCTHQGDYDAAHRAVDDGLAVIGALGDGWGYAFGSWVRANLAFEQGELDEAHRGHSEMLEVMRQVGLPVAMVAALHSLGVLELSRGRYADARTYFEEALELRRETGADRLGRYHGSTASELRDLARCALGEGDRAAAERYAKEGLDVARAYHDEEIAAGCNLILQPSS